MIRLSKIILVAAIALYSLLAAFGNITDYFTNFPAVERVLMMKDVFPNSTITYRALTNPALHHAAYLVIITCEALTGLFCALGAWRLFRARKQNAVGFNTAKTWSIAGLTLGFITWQVLFVSIGGEWFGMWMSQTFSHALSAAFQIFITILVIMVYVAAKDD